MDEKTLTKMKSNRAIFLLLTGILLFSLSLTSSFAEGTRELLVNTTAVGTGFQFDTTKSVYTGTTPTTPANVVQVWDQGPSPGGLGRATGTYTSILAANEKYRIKIRVCNVGEVINIGFNPSNNQLTYWRLYRPDGTCVRFNGVSGATNLSALGGGTETVNGATYTYRVPRSTESTQPGYIRWYSQAAVGPAPACSTVAAGGLGFGYAAGTYCGYTPIQYVVTAADMALAAADGTVDFFIVFNGNDPNNEQKTVNRHLAMFDVTIWNNAATRTVRKGRMFSAAWDINCNGSNNPRNTFNSKLYFYSKDSVLTSVSFNQMRPWGFIICANSTGTAATGVNDFDRRSRIQFNGAPDYPVFLNNPYSNLVTPADPNNVCGIVPKDGFGDVDTVTINGCDNDRCINILATKTGTVGITLLPNGGSSFVPKVFNNQTVVGNQFTCIPWDGTDGAGNLIFGPVSVQINYFNGLTNLPLYDVEDHPFGYRIDLEAPTASLGAQPILVYWDDRPPAGTGVTEFTAGSARDGLWDSDSNPLTADVVVGYHDGDPVNAFQSRSTYNLLGCDPLVDHSVSTTGIQGCHLWTGRGLNVACPGTSPNNCAETHNTWWNANVITKTATYYPSNVHVYSDTAAVPNDQFGNGGDASSRTKNVCYPTGSPVPIFGAIKVDPALTTDGSHPTIVSDYNDVLNDVNGTGTWSIVTGTGSFGSAVTNLQNTYIADAADLARGYVVLRITSDSTSVTPCGTANDTLRINLSQGPVVFVRQDLTVCSNNSLVSLNTGVAPNISGGNSQVTSFTWTPKLNGVALAGGTFVPNNQSVGTNATYTPPTSLTNVITVDTIITMVLSSQTGAGICPASKDSFDITVVARPVVNALDTLKICGTTAGTVAPIPAGQAIIVSPSLAVSNFTIQWTGNGSFTNATTLTPTYTPTAAELAAGIAKIVFRVTQNTPQACAAVQDTLIISFKNPPTVDAGDPASYCRNNVPNIPLSGTASNAGNISWTVSGGTGSFSPANNDTTTFTPTGSLPAGVGTYTFTIKADSVSGSPCPSVTDAVSVSFTDPPTIGIPTTAYTYCIGSPTVSISISGTITPGTTGQWFGNKDGTIPPFGTVAPNDQALDIIYTLSPAEVGFPTAIFFFSDAANGCLSVSDTALILPNPNPNIVLNDASVCADIASYNLPDASVYNPSNSPISSVLWSTLGSGTFDNPNDVNGPNYTPSGSDVSNGSVKIVLAATPLAAGCTPVRDTMTLTFTPGPAVSAGTNPTACANNPTATINGIATPAAATHVWSYVSGPTGTIANPNNLTTSFTASGTPAAGSFTVLRLTASLTGCSDVSDTMRITYTPSPTATITANVSTVCANNPVITLYGSSSTGAGTFSSSSGCVTCFGDVGRVGLSPAIDSTIYTPSATDISNGSVSFTLTTGNNGTCAAVPVSIATAITITPAPTSTISPIAAVCENNATMTLSATSSTGAGTWSSNSGCVSCFSAPSALSGTYTPSADDIANGSVTFTFTTGSNGNCIATQSTTTATINKAPSINAGPDLTVCSTQNTIALTSATSSNTTSVSWAVKAGAGDGSITNPSSLTGAVYNITATDKQNGTAIVVLTGNGTSPCLAVTQERIIQFTDIPTVAVGPDRTVCANDAPAILEATGSAGGTWTCAGCLAGITNATSMTASYTPAAGDHTPTPQTRTFTHSIPASGGCPAVSASLNITFNPAPLVTITTPATQCGNLMTISLTGTFTNSTGLIWTTPDGTGSFSNQTGTTTDYTLSAADTSGINSTVTFLLISTGSSPCSPDSATATVTITEPVILNLGNTQNQCGAAGTVISLAPMVLSGGATSVTWSIMGASTGTLTPTSATTATYTVGAGDAGTSITFQGVTNAVAPCAAQTDQVTHNFLAPVTSTISASPASFCQTGSVTLTGTITNTNTGTWTCTNCTGVGTFSPDASYNNLIPQTSVSFTPAPADTSASSLTFQLTSDAAHVCGATASATVNVTIDKKPDVDALPDMVRCANNNVITLPTPTVRNTTTGFWHAAATKTTGFTPSNVYPGAVSYDPDTTEVQSGFVTLTFIATPMGASTCPPDSAKFVVTFSDAPVANAGLDRTICKNNPTFNLAGTINPGTGFDANWTSPNCGTTCFSSPNSLTTNYTLSYPADTNGVSSLMLFFTATDPTGLCAPDRDTVVISLSQPPVVDITTTFPNPICNDNAFVNLTGTSTGGYNWSSTGTGTFQINAFQPNVVYPFTAADRAKANLAAPDNIIRIYLSSDNGFCLPVTDSVDIELTPAPVVTIAEGDSTTICANINSLNLNASVSQAGFNIDWTTSGDGTFTPDAPTVPAFSTTYALTTLDKSAGSIILVAHTTNPVGSTCLSASKQFKVNITPLPVINIGSPVTVCQTVTSVDLSDVSVTNATSTNWTTNGTGVFGVTSATVGAGSVYYPTYLLTPPQVNDVDLPSVTLTLTAVGCSTMTATKTISFTPKPTAEAGNPQTVCNEATSVSVTGTATNFSSVNWRVAGSGSTFATTANATYTLTAANKAAGFVNLVFTANGNGTCGSVTDTVRITIRPQPTLEIGPNASFCSKSAAEDGLLAYNFPAVTVTNSGISPQVAWGPASIMANMDTVGQVLSPRYTITSSDITAGSVTITATVRSHPSCNPVTDAMTINITKAPTIDAGPNLSICELSGSPSIQLNSSFTNGNGVPSWSSDKAGAFVDPNMVNPVYTPAGGENVAPNVTTLYATIQGNGSCPPATDSVKVTFTNSPAAPTLLDTTICMTSGTNLNYLVSTGLIGDWTTSAGSVLPDADDESSVTIQVMAIAAPATINITFDPTDACYPAGSTPATITIVEAPSVAVTSPLDVCINNFAAPINLTSTPANNSSVAWSIVQGFGTIGSGTSANATYTLNPDSSDFGLGSIMLKVTANATSATCAPAEDTVEIFPHQAPVISLANQTVCSDIVNDAGAITLDGNVNGTGYTGTTWSSAQLSMITSPNSLNTTATASALPATVTLTVNGLHASCAAVTANLTINPQTAPTFTSPGTDFNACSNGASVDLDNANMSPSVPGGVWSSATGGMFTPSTSGATGVSYTPSSNDITNGTVDLIYSITDTGVCYKDYNDTIRVTLNTPITVNSTTPIGTFCAQSNSVNINATTSVSPLPGGSTIAWTTPNGLGTFSSTTTLSTTYDPNPTNTPNGGDVGNGGAVLMVKLDLPAAYGCPDDSDFVSLLLVPEPAAIVNAGSAQQICVDRVSAQLQGLILNADGGVWRTTKYGNIFDASVQATGSFSDSTDLEADYFLSAADRTKASIRLYLYSVGGNALCSQVIDSVDISFTPIPVPSATASAASVCADVDSINLTGAFTAMGINGIWSSSGDGYFTNIGVFDPTPIYIPGPTDIAAGRVVFTYASNNYQDCQSYSATDTTIITPKIEVDAGPDLTVCGNNSAGITLTASSPPTNTGTWFPIGTAGVDYDGTFTTTAGSLQGLYIPGDTIDPVMGAVTFRFVSSGGTPCKPDSAQMIVKVAPAPTVTIATNTQTVCNDVTSINVNVTSISVATQGFWTSTGTGSFANPTALNTTYNFSTSDLEDSTNITIAFVTTDNVSDGSQCNAASDAMVITLKPKPVVTVLPQYNCVTPIGVTLDNSSVTYVDPGASGIWSTTTPATEGQFSLDKFITSPGGNAATYFPSAGDITRGTVTLVLTSTGAGTCQPVSRSVTLNVSNTPIADAGPDLFVCANSSVTLTATPKANLVQYDWQELPAGATYSGVQATAPMTGTNTSFELLVTDDRGCSNRDTVLVNAVADPLIDQTAQQCYDFFGYVTVAIGGPTSPLGGYQWFYNGQLMSGETKDSVRVTQPGYYQVFYSLGACTQPSDDSTLILDLPRVLTPDVIGCKNDTVTATLQEIPNAQLNNPPTIDEMPFESYVWTSDPSQPVTVPDGNPGILPTSTQNPLVVDTLTYYVTVSYTTAAPNLLTCSYNDSVRVISIPIPDPNIVDSTQVCEGTAVTLDANTPPSNLPQLAQFPQLIEWYASGTPATILATGATFSPTTSNDYVVQVTIGQCMGDDSARVDFRPFPVKTLSDEIKQCFEQVGSVTLDAGAPASVPGLTGVTYQWTSGDGDPALTTSTSQTTVITYAQIKDQEDEMIQAMVTTTNQFGPSLSCPSIDTIYVKDICVPKVFPPSVFHPGDGNPIDAEFTIKLKYVNLDKFKLTVYSRWGEVIFYSEDVNKHWDGTYRGELMPVGVYAYIITYEGKDEANKGPFRKEGRIVLVR